MVWGVLVALAALVGAGPVRAENVGITGRKLIVTDKLEFSNRASVRFLSVDSQVRKGVSQSTATIGATVDIAIEAFNQSPIGGAFSVPQGFSTTAGWRLNNASVAKFVNPGAPGGPTQVRTVTVQQNRLIKVAARGLGDLPLDLGTLWFGPFHVQVRVSVLNASETITHCTVFRSENCLLPFTASGTGRKLQCRNGEAVPDCVFPPLP
jgi:hypothetical protein